MGKRGPGTDIDRPWAEALRRAAFRESKGKGSPKQIEIIANNCVADAAGGDMQAIKEIGDRLDGKPHQSGDMKLGASDNLLALFNRIWDDGDK